MILDFIKKTDITLSVSIIFLIFMGLATIFSTSYSAKGTDFLNFEKQLVFIVIGVTIMAAVSFFDYRALKNYVGILYICALSALILLLFAGSQVRGTEGWFSFGIFNLQPVEFVKIVMIIVMAKYLSKTDNYAYKKIIVSGIYIFLPVLFILRQPDLGSSIVIAFIWFSMLSVSGIEKKYILTIFLIGVITFFFGWTFFLKEYQKERILTFANPQSDPLGSGYNVIQSIIAVGSGNVWGKGLGHGSQSQLNFLPEKHTDFIFAVIAEEMGFVGVLFTLILFAIVFHRLFKIAIETQDNFGKFLVLGTSFMLIFHVIVNVGMNMGIMPVTGIPLPFISYGGSSLIAFLIMIGVVQNVYIRGRRYKIEKEENI